MSKRQTIRNLLLLQAVVVLYTMSGIMAKMASGQEWLSIGFIGFYGAELFFLGLYAIFWQQMIRRFELSVAYANRAMALVWSLLWAVLLFHDHVTVKNVIGILFVIVGTLIVNSEEGEEAK